MHKLSDVAVVLILSVHIYYMLPVSKCKLRVFVKQKLGKQAARLATHPRKPNQKKFDILHIIMYTYCMERENPLEAVFYETEQGNQPCRDYLLSLSKDDRREVGADVFAVQQDFPLGLPLCRKMGIDLWEIRSDIADGISRVFFTVDKGTMILLHGFTKKTQKTPQNEIDTAERRLKDYRRQSR